MLLIPSMGSQHGSRHGGSQPTSLPSAPGDSPLPRPPCVPLSPAAVWLALSRGWTPCNLLLPLSGFFAPLPHPGTGCLHIEGLNGFTPISIIQLDPGPKLPRYLSAALLSPEPPRMCRGGHHPHTEPRPSLGLHGLAAGLAVRLWVSPPLPVPSGCRGIRGTPAHSSPASCCPHDGCILPTTSCVPMCPRGNPAPFAINSCPSRCPVVWDPVSPSCSPWHKYGAYF